LRFSFSFFHRWGAFLILLDIVDEPMNGSSYAQCATPQYLKTVQFSSVNRESLAQTWLSSTVGQKLLE